MQKNGVIICGNLRGLRENKTPAKLAEKRRKDITRFKGIILKSIDNVNIPSQMVYRDSTTLQFTFTGLFFSTLPAYEND